MIYDIVVSVELLRDIIEPFITVHSVEDEEAEVARLSERFLCLWSCSDNYN